MQDLDQLEQNLQLERKNENARLAEIKKKYDDQTSLKIVIDKYKLLGDIIKQRKQEVEEVEQEAETLFAEEAR